MTSAARVEANRRNALRSTGPRTAAGKAKSSLNAGKHFLGARSTGVLMRGAFAEDQDEAEAFVLEVMAELAPRGVRETAEALHIAALYLRRARLPELEAVALAGTTRAPLLAPETPGGPARITEQEQERAAHRALDASLLDKLPRYEAHLSRELDRSLNRYRAMQQDRADALTVLT